MNLLQSQINWRIKSSKCDKEMRARNLCIIYCMKNKASAVREATKLDSNRQIMYLHLFINNIPDI